MEWEGSEAEEGRAGPYRGLRRKAPPSRHATWPQGLELTPQRYSRLDSGPWTGDRCLPGQAGGRQLRPSQPRSPTGGRWLLSTVPKAVRVCPGHPLRKVHFSQALSQRAATHPTWLLLSVHQRGRGRGQPGLSATRPSVHGCLRHWVSLAASTDLQGEAWQFQDFPRRKKQKEQGQGGGRDPCAKVSPGLCPHAEHTRRACG